MSFESFLGSNVGGLATSAASGVGTTIANKILGNNAAKQNYQYQKKLIDYQNDINQRNYQIQRADKISDILHATSREVQSKKMAGLNPSLGMESGGAASNAASDVQGADLNTPSTGPNMMQPVQVTDLLNNAALMSQIALNNANAEKSHTDSEKGKTETQIMQERWNTEQKTYGETLQANLENLISSYQKNDAEKAKILDEGRLVVKNLEKVDFDMQQAKKLNDASIKKIDAEISLMSKQELVQIATAKNLDEVTKFQQIKNRFAEYGIGIASSDIQALAALALSGKGEEASIKAVAFFKDAISGIFTGVKNAITPNVIQGAKDVANKVYETGKDIVTWPKRKFSEWLEDANKRWYERMEYERKHHDKDGRRIQTQKDTKCVNLSYPVQ